MPRTTEADDPFDAAPMSASLHALARRGVVSRLRRGVQIITEGDRGDSLYIVLSGQLRTYSVNAEGKEVTYSLYGPGEFVGEMGLDGGLRSANAETTRPSLCALVTRTTLERHLAEEPAFAFELLAKVIRQARQATLSLRQIALNDVYGRLKALLEVQSKAQGDGTWLWQPASSHLEISRQLGCSREMVSRVLKDLETGGYVQVGRRRVVLRRVLPSKW